MLTRTTAVKYLDDFRFSAPVMVERTLFSRGGLDMTRTQSLKRVLSDGRIICENVSWR